MNVISIGMFSHLYDVFFYLWPVSANRRENLCCFTTRKKKIYPSGQNRRCSLFHQPRCFRLTENCIPEDTKITCTFCYHSSLGKHLLQNFDPAADRHKKLRHISAGKLFESTKIIDKVLNLTLEIIWSVFCNNCLVAKAKRAPIEPSGRYVVRPLELIHMDLLRSIKTVSIGERFYALGIIHDFTAYSTIFILSARAQVYVAVREFMSQAKNSTGLKL